MQLRRATLFVVMAAFVAATAGAADHPIRSSKKKLIRELLELTDAPEGTADAIIDMLGGRLGLPIAPDATRFETREGEQVAKIAEETQLEVYDRYFSERQLRDLITFFKSKTGRHYVEVARKMAAETRNNIREATTRGLNQTNELARRDRTRNDLGVFALAMTAYYHDHQRYPEGQSMSDVVTALVPKYAPSIAQQDAWGRPFRYEVSADGQHYRAVSVATDGKLGGPTPDDIVMSDGKILP